MYSTCIFCSGRLGNNEALEHFPVGRRLAYDAEKGRLWVVCRTCERWNLTPLESRWEAIEEAERLFRATKLRRSSDNIALAELREGTQLVRIGAPPPLEFAAWRYGDQFGRRRIKYVAYGVGVMSLAFIPVVGLGAGATISTIANLANLASSRWETHRRQKKRVAVVHDSTGKAQSLTVQNARCVELAPVGSTEGWEVFVPYGGEDAHKLDRGMKLSGVAAARALANILPVINVDGGTRRGVRDAVALVNEASSLSALLDGARSNRTPFRSSFKLPAYTTNIALLPNRYRLALEMSLHTADERRAMDGELGELEDRWRAAEEIAAIADSLLVAPEIENRIAAAKITK